MCAILEAAERQVASPSLRGPLRWVLTASERSVRNIHRWTNADRCGHPGAAAGSTPAGWLAHASPAAAKVQHQRAHRRLRVTLTNGPTFQVPLS
jgi:hypothetical protein